MRPLGTDNQQEEVQVEAEEEVMEVAEAEEVEMVDEEAVVEEGLLHLQGGIRRKVV